MTAVEDYIQNSVSTKSHLKNCKGLNDDDDVHCSLAVNIIISNACAQAATLCTTVGHSHRRRPFPRDAHKWRVHFFVVSTDSESVRGQTNISSGQVCSAFPNYNDNDNHVLLAMFTMAGAAPPAH